MILADLKDSSLRQAIQESINLGIADKFTKAWQICDHFHYDCQGRWGAAANRIKMIGQKINDEMGWDWMGAHFPLIALHPDYEA